MVDTYEHDYFAWIEQQARLLAERRFADLDLLHLIDEIEDLGRAEKREIESCLGELLLHLLKWAYQTDQRSGSWASTIVEQRARIRRRVQASPSLEHYPAEILDEEYQLARRRAAAESGVAIEAFPSTCTYSIDQVLDLDFLP